jgi:uncharacterized lipoprotein YddW (UPF0748 family)
MKTGWVRWLVILPLVLFAAAAAPSAEGEKGLASADVSRRGETAWLSGQGPVSKEVRAFWADAFAAGLKTRAEIDQLVARVQEANANTIIAQVRRRGDSFYINSAEPFTEDANVEAGLDPLAYLLERAHAVGIEVHAWVAVNTVYSGHPFIATATWPCMVPCSPDHVFNTHGFFVAGDDNWLTQTHPNFTAGTVRYPATGTPLIPLGWRLSDGNWWMDPGHPAAADYTVNVIKHLVANYAIDGLHLDRIRYPEMPIARPTPTGPIGFSTGYNPVSVRRFNAAFGRAEGTLPDPWDADWSQWRRDQMNQLVRRLFLEIVHIKPKMKVSASTIAFWRGPGQLGGFQNTEAYSRVFQDWDGWLRDGFLDLNVPMIYKPVPSAENGPQFTDWTRFAAANQYGRQTAIGLGVYLNVFEDSLAQLAESRLPAPSNGARAVGQSLYSYATTNKVTANVPHRPHAEFFRALSEDGAYTPDAPYGETAGIPVMPWKKHPQRGSILAQVIDTDGAPADGASVTIKQIIGWPGQAPIAQTADGNGYSGATELPLGLYQLIITTPEGTFRTLIPRLVLPGFVNRFAVRLGWRPRGPMLRTSAATSGAGAFSALSAAGVPDGDVSPLELWRDREPIAEDILALPPAGAQP